MADHDDIIELPWQRGVAYYHPRLNYGIRVQTIQQMEVVRPWSRPRIEATPILPQSITVIDEAGDIDPYAVLKEESQQRLRDVYVRRIRHAKSPMQERGVFD